MNKSAFRDGDEFSALFCAAALCRSAALRQENAESRKLIFNDCISCCRRVESLQPVEKVAPCSRRGRKERGGERIWKQELMDYIRAGMRLRDERQGERWVQKLLTFPLLTHSSLPTNNLSIHLFHVLLCPVASAAAAVLVLHPCSLSGWEGNVQ